MLDRSLIWDLHFHSQWSPLGHVSASRELTVRRNSPAERSALNSAHTGSELLRLEEPSLLVTALPAHEARQLAAHYLLVTCATWQAHHWQHMCVPGVGCFTTNSNFNSAVFYALQIRLWHHQKSSSQTFFVGGRIGGKWDHYFPLFWSKEWKPFKYPFLL